MKGEKKRKGKWGWEKEGVGLTAGGGRQRPGFWGGGWEGGWGVRGAAPTRPHPGVEIQSRGGNWKAGVTPEAPLGAAPGPGDAVTPPGMSLSPGRGLGQPGPAAPPAGGSPEI